MNRIETKIVMTVTNRLAAAPDSEAKTELIEELSENLYQRYQDLTAKGMPEEEAIARAIENLGDVEELLAYLESEDAQREEEKGKASHKEKDGFFGSNFESFIEDAVNSAFAEGSWGQNLGKNLEKAVNVAVSATREAVDHGKGVARDVSEQIREKYPDGVFSFVGDRGQAVEGTVIPAEPVHSLMVRLTNGDVQVRFTDEPNAPIEISGDTEDIEIMQNAEGVLSIRQGGTASSSFLFNKGMRASDIDVRLPLKHWENVSITTVNGDIRIEHGLECRVLAVQTTSGDLEAAQMNCERMAFRLVSGDIRCENLTGDLYAETKSGDIEVTGWLGRCGLSSISGDVQLDGKCREANCTSTSGDVKLNLTSLPERMKVAAKSGDCSVRVPKDAGFTLSYRTVSGEFRTDLEFSGPLGEKSGEAVRLDGGNCTIQMASVRGDLEVCS